MTRKCLESKWILSSRYLAQISSKRMPIQKIATSKNQSREVMTRVRTDRLGGFEFRKLPRWKHETLLCGSVIRREENFLARTGLILKMNLGYQNLCLTAAPGDINLRDALHVPDSNHWHRHHTVQVNRIWARWQVNRKGCPRSRNAETSPTLGAATSWNMVAIVQVNLKNSA